jgi:DNA-binding Lrp family transcriptional regulator
MVTAYVMLKAHTGEADRLRDAIERVDGVERAHIVAGDVDLVAVVNVDTPAGVKKVAATEIQAIDGVGSTQTYVAMD